MIVLMVAVAFPADPRVEAPERALFSAPPTGVTRVRLPADVVGADPASLGGALWVQNAAGEVVPFSFSTTDRVPFNEEKLDLVQETTHRWRVGPSTRAVRWLRFDDLRGGWHPAQLQVAGVGSFVFPVGTIAGETIDVRDVPVPEGVGPWLVDSAQHLFDVVGVSYPAEWVAPDCVTVPAEAPALTEAGFARYALDLGGPRRVRSLQVHSDAELFDREVQVFVPSETREYYGAGQPLRRLRLGAATFDATRLEELDLAADALLVDIRTDAGQVLPVSGFEVCTTGAELLLRDPGPGPHTVYVGGGGGTLSSDLSFAGPELARLATSWVTDVTVEPNPDHVPLETREGLDAPGAAIPLVKWKWERPFSQSGWQKVRLDREVLARSQADLHDLRVVDAEGRQVPHLLRRTGRESAWEAGEVQRTESGRTTELRIPLGQDDAPVATLRLTTSRDVFSRSVTILRDRGTITEPLRSVQWQGDGQGTTIAVAIDAVVGRELLVRIDNGDNAPLPIEGATVTFPEWELRANVPEGGRLVYGSRTAAYPSYDLSLLQTRLNERKLPVGELGEAKALGGPMLATGERVAVLAVVGVLTLGLLALLARLLLTAREPDAPEGGADKGPVGAAPRPG